MKYPFDVCFTKTGDEIRWIARSKVLHHTIGVGKTMAEAINLLEELEECVLEPWDENDKSVPPTICSSDDLIIRLGDYDADRKEIKELKKLIEDFFKRPVDIIY